MINLGNTTLQHIKWDFIWKSIWKNIVSSVNVDGPLSINSIVGNQYYLYNSVGNIREQLYIFILRPHLWNSL